LRGVVPLYKTINKKEVKMSSLMERLMKAGSVKGTSILSESQFFNEKETVPTDVPIINIGLSSKLDGGLSSGLTFLAGPSKHFKSLLGLLLVKAYLDKYKDAICMFFDSEFGITPEYISANGIDTSRVMHIPIEHLEQLKFDISKRLEEINRGDKVIIFIDSIGNLASKKEVEDALEEKSVADMSRAKTMKSLWRIVTPALTTKDIPCVAVNHTYQTMEMFSKTVMGGGCVAEGTKIIMSDGSLKNIENIVEGDYVKTLIGDKRVKHTWNPDTLMEGTPECFEFEFEDGYKVICSQNHRFLVGNEWVEATDLREGYEVVDIKVLA
jgi:RecA/RadA recombinase